MTFPSLLTEATLLLLLVQTGLIPELTFAFSTRDLPFLRETDVLLSEIAGGTTVTSHSFVTPSTVAVIVAVPCFFAVTSPLASTVAILFLRDFQDTVRPEETFAVRRQLCVRYSDRVLRFSVTFGFFTVTRQLFLVPSAAAVMTVSPTFTASILPYSSMAATLDRDDRQVTGEPLEVFAVRRKEAPFSIDTEAAESVRTVFWTVTRQLASPPLTLAVILQVPAFFAVTWPYVLTEATLELLLFHEILLKLLEIPER